MKICKKSLIRRCSKCKAAYYCSEDCQKKDWQDGHHQRTCGPHRNVLGLSMSTHCLDHSSSDHNQPDQFSPPKLPFRDRQFRRAVMHADFKLECSSICEKECGRELAICSGMFFELQIIF